MVRRNIASNCGLKDTEASKILMLVQNSIIRLVEYAKMCCVNKQLPRLYLALLCDVGLYMHLVMAVT